MPVQWRIGAERLKTSGLSWSFRLVGVKAEEPETLRAQFTGMQKAVEDSLTLWEDFSMKMWLRSSNVLLQLGSWNLDLSRIM